MPRRFDDLPESIFGEIPSNLARALENALADSPIDTSVPHAARVWNHWLGGKDTYPTDRHAGDLVADRIPGIIDAALHDRAFLGRAVHHAAQAGIAQFLDIGTGMPAVDNTHQIAQRTAVGARTVYVDNDPLVLAHARALLTGTGDGVVDHIDADIRDTGTILARAGRVLDFSRPVALMLLGVLSHLVDDAEARTAVNTFADALAPGSHVVIAHPTAELHGDLLHDSLRLLMQMGAAPVVARTPARIAAFFDGLDLLEPGVVSCSHWRPPLGLQAPAVLQYCGVARKPDRPSPRSAPQTRPIGRTLTTPQR
ncbi:hypothetical protein BJF79_31220 [Actinomadura sp. CNU-125]|uniref:SAM-dependent methyltransferase n=1 Tax=Actinomadura sp. CNU-125 TaxID=1904961 RepID=UPI00095B0E9E|nr:SAM-dependent methyltransferase [Actinomadura sp. CNU-125]OLT36350.1 hypothetical protein BJF79_31220 [Actinomadura sp. CNU-125]